MRITTFLAFSLMTIGAIGIPAAQYFTLPKGVHLGVFVIGAGLLIGAIESLYTRRMSLRASSPAVDAYDGLPAVIWGLMLLLVAGCLISAAYAMDVGRWHTITAYLDRQPGPIYALVGLLLIGTACLAFVNPRGRHAWWRTLVFRVPRVLFAVLLLLAGLIALACSAWEWLNPNDFQNASKAILAIIESSTPQGWPRELLKRFW